MPGRPMQCMRSRHVLEQSEIFFESVGQEATFKDWSREFRVREPEIVDNTLSEPLRECWSAIEQAAEGIEDETKRNELMDGARRLRELHGGLKMFLDQEDDESVYWVEKGGNEGTSFSLNAAPINIADRLRPILFGPDKSCITTSATLGTGDEQLRYFRERVGADHVPAVKIGSPFDYQKQMSIYVIKSMPDPRDDDYEKMLIHWIGRVLIKTEGKSFCSFHQPSLTFDQWRKKWKIFSRITVGRFWHKELECPGRRLVETFREDIHSVLFGTDSFWAGVDVPGEALSNVIVTRIPFAVPDHPLTAARLEEIEAEGGEFLYGLLRA